MDPCNFINEAISHTPEVEIHTRPKLYHFCRYLVKAKLFCQKCFVPVTGLECSYGKIFIPVNEISVAKTEISVTGPARPLIWTHRYFYKEKSGEARSQKPSQPGWPRSYEEALRSSKFYSWSCARGCPHEGWGEGGRLQMKKWNVPVPIWNQNIFFNSTSECEMRLRGPFVPLIFNINF